MKVYKAGPNLRDREDVQWCSASSASVASLQGKEEGGNKAFVTLHPDAGCETLCGILEDLFDSPHIVARSLLDGLFEVVKSNQWDAEALWFSVAY